MPKKLRLAPAGYNLHVTQRGNYGQQTFFTAYDYAFFLDLVSKHAPRRSVDVLAYCLMPNHFHLILRGRQSNSIATFMQFVNGQYAQDLHKRLERVGRFWQDRYFSCVLDNAHLVAALGYVELNPVRAGMVERAIEYPWSSASIHVGAATPPAWMQLSTFQELFTPAEWRYRLTDGQAHEEDLSLRNANKKATVAMGSPGFVKDLEREFQRKLEPRGPGRPRGQRAASA